MELKNLKTGMVVKLRNGDYYMVIGNYLINNSGWDSFSEYNDDLTSKNNAKFSIVEVYEKRDRGDLIPRNWFKEIEEEEPIWKREGEIDWAKVPKWTKIQVRDYDNKEWRNAYFLGYYENNNYPFKATFCDKFSFENFKNDSDNGDCWKQCRLYKEEGEE